jgi:hypothetical protein
MSESRQHQSRNEQQPEGRVQLSRFEIDHRNGPLLTGRAELGGAERTHEQR